MPFNNKIVEYINEVLQTSLKSELFVGAKFYGVATSVPMHSSSNNDVTSVIVPGVTDVEGEIEAVSTDDRYPMMVYHKNLTNNYSAIRKSYGDSNDIRCISEMQLFVSAFSDRIKMNAEQLEPIILFSLPGKLSSTLTNDLLFSRCSIAAVSSNMEKISNFQSEFKGVDYFFSSEQIFFSIRYQIIKDFDTRCMQLCTC